VLFRYDPSCPPWIAWSEMQPAEQLWQVKV
jgi:hypothetical protein